MSARLTPEIQARAVEIADESMLALVRGHGVPLDETFDRFALCNGRQGEVRTLDEADPVLVEAFEYLKERGFASLVTEPDGAEVIQLDETAS